ncbi:MULTISPECIES: TRAP transporter small permease subunit [Thalassolituus]|jgi:TRAP-type mannitol/chloroaromatic compound transport system permease small subunit|uniref:TRAP transporter small permease subunit n=1 Tax=Thalassolituus TaxID=187492 RepID=UPI00042DC333|nr:TRAP transporter small permease subunit [Thalassolituus oleivorans]AHK14684.1 C4-dicarboxylate ABC transporter permease [Thalassolituus oleivorans R6-15]MCA6127691.1 C4-dicarboxylate ABC transporter permease [Thalassolituus oleivorans 4BN06-13]
MQQLINILDGITQKTGQAIRWLALLMVLISCGVVLLRYSFDQPSIAMQEAVMYLHATIFMLGSAYTWQQGGHVRVDVFYRSWSKQRRRWVDRLGIIFLVLPTCLFMLWVSWTYVGNAWAIQERSQEASGLPYIYLLKTLILMLPITLILQAIAELLRSLTATDTGAAQYD